MWFLAVTGHHLMTKDGLAIARYPRAHGHTKTSGVKFGTSSTAWCNRAGEPLNEPPGELAAHVHTLLVRDCRSSETSDGSVCPGCGVPTPGHPSRRGGAGG